MIIAETTFKNTSTIEQFYPQPFYWYMGHFSRYVPPGSHRVNVTNPLDPTGNGGDSKGKPDGSLEVFAALTPQGQVSVVALNRNDDPISFELQDAATGRSASLTVGAHSVHTYWYGSSDAASF